MSKTRRGSISQMINRLSSKMMMAIALGSMISIFAMLFVLYNTSQFLNLSRTSGMAAEVLEDVLEARLDAFKFRVSGETDISESFTGNVDEVFEVNDLIRNAGVLAPDAAAALSLSDDLVAQYAAAFERIAQLRAPRNELVAEMADTGRDIRLNLTKIMETASRDGDPVAATLAGRAQENLLLGRLYTERYLLDNVEEDFARAKTAFQDALSGLDALLVELDDPTRRQLVADAQASIVQFETASEAAHQVILERNGHRADMDRIGPELLSAVEFVMDSMTTQQQAVGNQLKLIGWLVIAGVALSSAVVLLLARKNSQKAAAYIKNSIDHFVTAMTEVANGNLDVDLGRKPDEATEIARMGDALEIFQKNAKERIELQNAQEQQKEQQEREREAQRVREDKAKQEAQKRIDDERNALLERLEQSVGAVVDFGAKGDFSHRVKVDFNEESLRRMAEGINTLLQNVDDGLKATSQVLFALSNGDLTELMEGEYQGAFKELQNNTNGMISGLQTLVGEISGSTVNLASSSSELRDTSDALSKQAEQNAASLEETSAALEELTASIKQVSENVADASYNAGVASDTAKSSSEVAEGAAEAMNRIADASTEIAKVVTVINDIAFQINLLALNAGVEAARAGEAGRGFSVVASEVRQLAQRAGEAATEIDDVIARSDTAVTDGVAKVTDARESLNKISDSVVGVSQRIEEISSAISEQVNGIGEINSAVSQIDGNTQKQAASFEEVTAASSLLSNEAEALKQSTARFKTGGEIVALKPQKAPTAATPSAIAPRLVDDNLARDLDGWDEF